MYTGSTLEDLHATIREQDSAKEDYIADTRDVKFYFDEEGRARLDVLSADDFAMTSVAERQLGSRIGVPSRFYDRLSKDHPDVLTDTMNKLMHREPKNYMIRTLHGRARAVLSDRYQRIDNRQVLHNATKSIQESHPGAQVASCDLSDSKMHLKLKFPQIEAEVKVGDVVNFGLQISNSEIGQGSVQVSPFVYRLVCDNGMVLGSKMSEGWRRAHVGVQQETGAVLRAETLDAESRATMMIMQDQIAHLCNPDAMQEALGWMQESANREVTGSPVAAVRTLSQNFDLTEAEEDAVLTSFLGEKDYTQWGLLNAVTDASKSAHSYARATEMESMGGRVLELDTAQWNRIAEAA